MNTLSTGKDFMSNTRFKSDWFFGNVDDRKWYAGRDDASLELGAQNAALKNTFGMKRYKGMPVQNYSLTVGAPFEFGYNQKIGFVAALTYRNGADRGGIQGNDFHNKGQPERAGQTLQDGYFHRRSGQCGVGKCPTIKSRGAICSITALRIPISNVIYTNITTGFNTYEQYSVPIRSQLWQTQLDGEHKLFDENLIVTWNASFNQVERTNPDDRYARGGVQGDVKDGMVNWTSSITSSEYGLPDGHLMYSNLKERKENVGLNLEHPFVISGNKQVVKAGYMGTFRTSDYVQQYLHGMFPVGDRGEAWDAWTALRDSHPELNELYDPKKLRKWSHPLCDKRSCRKHG